MSVIAAVLGSPVSHSLSPAIHRAAFGLLGVRGTIQQLNVKQHT
jgi:shikimate 5-dehydrogenase